MTLAEVCAAHAPGPIHLLKVGCEGAERAVMKVADFTCWRPWVVLVEALDPRTLLPNYAAWEEELLLAAGYRFAWFDALNRFYVAEEHYERLTPRLALPPNVFDNFVRAAVPPPALPAADSVTAETPAGRDG